MASGEFDLIRKYFLKNDLQDKDLLTGIGDDAAQIAIAGRDIFITNIVLTEGQHFQSGHDPAELGQYVIEQILEKFPDEKAIPRWLTLALQLPDYDEYWLQRFSSSLNEYIVEKKLYLIGGDTTKGNLSICLHLFGSIR